MLCLKPFSLIDLFSFTLLFWPEKVAGEAVEEGNRWLKPQLCNCCLWWELGNWQFWPAYTWVSVTVASLRLQLPGFVANCFGSGAQWRSMLAGQLRGTCCLCWHSLATGWEVTGACLSRKHWGLSCHLPPSLRAHSCGWLAASLGPVRLRAGDGDSALTKGTGLGVLGAELLLPLVLQSEGWDIACVSPFSR